MRKNVEHRSPKSILVIVSVLFVVAALVGLVVGYEKLKELYLERCVITDLAEQVRIESGKMVKADVLAENFGLRKGANLALVDYAAKRAETLNRIPNLKDVSVTRHLPDSITIVTEERTPVARVNRPGVKSESGRVVDTEGVVFLWQRGTQLLPVIREGRNTNPGSRLEGRAQAALKLIEAALEPSRTVLGVLEVDITKPDFLVATLGDYSKAKIAWEGMDEMTPTSVANMCRQLDRLVKAIKSGVGTGAKVWNATDTSTPARIYADLKGIL